MKFKINIHSEYLRYDNRLHPLLRVRNLFLTWVFELENGIKNLTQPNVHVTTVILNGKTKEHDREKKHPICSDWNDSSE